MTSPRIAVIVGSLSRASINRCLAVALMRLGARRFDFIPVVIGDLPLYDRDLDADLPTSVRRVKRQIEAADGVLLLTPEYNRSVPAALKNAIDWASRPYGENSWRGKPAAVAGISVGALGTAPAQQHLRNILSHLDVHVLPQPEVCMGMREGLFATDGGIADMTTRQFLDGFLTRFADYVAVYGSRT